MKSIWVFHGIISFSVGEKHFQNQKEKGKNAKGKKEKEGAERTDLIS